MACPFCPGSLSSSFFGGNSVFLARPVPGPKCSPSDCHHQQGLGQFRVRPSSAICIPRKPGCSQTRTHRERWLFAHWIVAVPDMHSAPEDLFRKQFYVNCRLGMEATIV